MMNFSELNMFKSHFDKLKTEYFNCHDSVVKSWILQDILEIETVIEYLENDYPDNTFTRGH